MNCFQMRHYIGDAAQKRAGQHAVMGGGGKRLGGAAADGGALKAGFCG